MFNVYLQVYLNLILFQMLESYVSGDAYHRCIFCKVCLPTGELYINHVKEHLSEYRTRNQQPYSDPESNPSQSTGKLRKLRKKRRKKRTKEIVIETPKIDKYSDDCLGDSELSESDTEEDRKDQIEKERREMKTILARTRLSLAEKQLDTGDSEDLVCLTCLKKFSNIQNLRRHLRLHITRDSNLPDIDSEADMDDKLFKFSCDFCPEKFANKSAYLVHDKTHGDKQPECYICNKKYADRYSLRYHLRTHGIGYQIRCELCNKSFPKPSRLQSHINTFHKNIRNFSCSKCDKSFKTRLHLENHTLMHTGERPHRCDECGEFFRHKVSLIAHQRIHGDIRPYVCETCGKCFREPSTMKAHMRVHSGDKPYKCDVCEKSFSQRAGLNYHKTVHNGMKPYRCSKCDYATVKHTSLRNHERAIHKIDPTRLKDQHLLSSSPELELDPSPSELPIPGGISLVSGSSLPLPSPPLQDGDALLTESSVSQTQNIYNNHHSNSLPSFNILKSYESTTPQGTIMSETIKSNKDECVMSDRQSPYSQPSLSPPLTPPGQDYSYSSHPLYQRHNQQYSYSSPLNYSTNFNRECETSFVETGEYFHRGKFSGEAYCSVGRDQKKGYTQYENYYDYSYYQPRSLPIHTNFEYQ